jgi:uncharacterized protein (TIGR02421 family)
MGIRTSLPPTLVTPPPSGPAATARSLGSRLAAALRPVRVLDAVRWPQEAETAFLAAGGNGLPAVTPDTYHARPLPFDPAATRAELGRLDRDTRDQLGTDQPAARLLLKAIREGELTVRLVEARGTPAFAELSRELYGTTCEADWPAELASMLKPLLPALPAEGPADRSLSAGAAAADLATRFAGYFGATAGVQVTLCAAIASDAAAGNGYLKLRAAATFSPADVRMLEVHEGWAHLGTTLNARLQSVLPVLGWCSPSATRTQEGLAVFLELITGVAGRNRVRKILDRVMAVGMAEAGADFRDVYRHLLSATGDGAEAYRQSARVFRGSLPTGGPFTKDLSYGEGLVRVVRFVRNELTGGGWGRVRLLMCGKTAVEDVGLLAELGRSGWLTPPRWVPPPLRDRAALLTRLETLPGAGYNAP